MDFFTLFPNLEPWVANLATVWPASVIKPSIWMFAVIEAVHLLMLGLLGGCVIVLNMRLLGAGLTNEPISVVERNLRLSLWIGVGGVLLTGVAIGMSNAEKLYTSPAFFVKMISLAAGLIFSFGVTNVVARNEGAISTPMKAAAGVAFLLWLASIGVFGSAIGANPGTVHLVVAGYAILFAFGSRLSRFLGGGTLAALVIVGAVLTYGVWNVWDHYELVTAINIWFVRIAALILVGLLGYEIFASKHAETSSTVKLIALFSILTWVTIAAAGRWIGLS
ncbi:MAG: DUF6644 family protein [Alphaproteobacteria bacterium]|nr:DUF6644 family protein [Alphaproteobacteria bacterium]